MSSYHQGSQSPASPDRFQPRTALSSPPIAPAPVPRPKRRRRGPALILLAVLAILVALGAIFGSSLFKNSSALKTPTVSAASGPFVKPPLNATQINSIMHLTGYMKYKQLAALYVSRMSLDEEIGQLIMVEYGQTSYSSDLDYMINNLHAGGVIMYEFQMLTYNQTKSDIAEMQRRASIPLLISTDEEGGPYVHRLSHIYGLRMSATDIANTGDPNVATQQGLKAAHDLLSLGINE
ncbi:MAG TPA: glycoside hydrolase family 3 N-terminal domain-containing protein, partial [Ktedonobacteraceae bacterium]|nr:glycoside hydrolase family 3 N-terminal domain-containing protein [Ktedonobacteraceae bacterium]